MDRFASGLQEKVAPVSADLIVIEDSEYPPSNVDGDSRKKVQIGNLPGGSGGADWGDIGGTLADQSDLQSALNGKSATGHTHVEADITDLGTYADASHTHVEADITDLGSYAVTGHEHTASTIDSETATDGYVLTADGAGGSAWEAAAGGSSDRVVIVKTSDETKASTTTFAADSTLYTGTLEASSIYRIMASITWAGHVSYDIKFRWHKESGLGDGYLSGSYGNNSVSSACQVFDTAMNGVGGGVAATRRFNWVGHIITGANTGVLSLQWAQLASGADVSTVFAGSWIVLEKIN